MKRLILTLAAGFTLQATTAPAQFDPPTQPARNTLNESPASGELATLERLADQFPFSFRYR